MPSDAELREMLARATARKPKHQPVCLWSEDRMRARFEMVDAFPALLTRIEVLEKALRPFAEVADAGKEGGAFVIAHAVYADMQKGVSAPRQSYWHWSDFDAARTAIEGGKP
jgi:hypothetical protein